MHRADIGDVHIQDRLDRKSFALEVPYAPPTSDAERRLTAIWQSVLGIDGLGIDDDFFLPGGDSLLAVTLFGQVERAFGRIPPLSTFLECPTIRLLAGRLLADRLTEPVEGAGATPLIAIRAGGAAPPLFFTHAIRGDVLFARRVVDYLEADQPLYAIRARGLESGEEPHCRFETMAADFVTLIRRVQPKGPYFLAGYCAGSLSALEMARQLRAAGDEIGFVGLIDPNTHPNAAPWLYWREPDARPVYWLRRAIALRDLVRSRTGLLENPDMATGRSQQAEDGRAGIERRKVIWKATTAALAAYRPRPYDGSVTIFGSTRRVAHLAARSPGWRALATAPEVVSFPGGHRDLFGRHLPQLGEALRAALARARTAYGE